jgi:histidinol-phosphatase (PHP family)
MAAILEASNLIVNERPAGYTPRRIMPIIADLHMHTPLCKHAAGPMEAYVERAIELGLSAVGFSDHNPLPRGLGANVRMDEAELDYYVNRVQDLRFAYLGKIEVLLGLEMDYLDGLEDYLAKQIAQYPWDYVIGSVHYLDADCRVGSWTRSYAGDTDAQYALYYDAVRKMVRSGLYDIVAHLDVVKRSGRALTDRGAEETTRTLVEIAKAGLCLEINTSGYRHPELPQPQPYPSLPFIVDAIKLGIPLMVNSDAHAPEQVGTKFAEMETFLLKNGCRHLVRFERQEREMYAL